MNPALEEYMEKISPEAKKLFTRITSDMTEEQQGQFLAGIQLGDQEFAAEVQRYMPEGVQIDPTRARLKSLPPEAGVGPLGLTLKGISNPGPDPAYTTFKDFQYEFEPNTVSAVEAVNATAPLFAHEYRHLMDLDGPEMINRVQDLMASQNYKELRDNLRGLSDFAYSFEDRRIDGTQAAKDRMDNYYNASFDQEEKYVVDAIENLLKENSVKSMMYVFRDEIKNARVSPFYRDLMEKGPEKATQRFKEGGKLDYLPDAYRDGGRTKII